MKSTIFKIGIAISLIFSISSCRQSGDWEIPIEHTITPKSKLIFSTKDGGRPYFLLKPKSFLKNFHLKIKYRLLFLSDTPLSPGMFYAICSAHNIYFLPITLHILFL